MLEADDASFERTVLHSPRPVVVDFWAPWCGPCKAATKALEALAAEHADRIDLVGVNVDESPATASRYSVLSLPTAILFEAGEARETVVGARRQSHYERAWAAWLRD